MGLGLTTRTLGVIGAGGIGRELLALARPFGWKMLAADPYVDPAGVAALGAECVPLEQLLQRVGLRRRHGAAERATRTT